MSKSTPGPWEWDKVSLPGLGQNRWCEVLNSPTHAVVRHETSGGPTPWGVDPADARLIAAAPTQQAALIEIQSQCAGHSDEFSRRVWQIAEEALRGSR